MQPAVSNSNGISTSNGSVLTAEEAPPAEPISELTVLAGQRPPVEAKAPRDVAKLRFRLVLALAVVLALTLAGTLVYGKTLLDDRDSTISGLQQDVATLTTTNQSLQDQTASLTAERDTANAQITQLSGQVSDLNGQVTQLSGQVTDLNAQVTDLQRQLTQARDETARQQQLAADAQTLSGQLQAVVDLDTQIQNEFANLTYYLALSFNDYLDGNYATALTELDLANVAADQLDVLLPQREALLSELGQ